MVKITNKFGDVKRGKQHTVVYQGHYGNQTRRMLKNKKDEHTRGQLEQRERFRVGIDFAKSLTKAQKDFIKSYMTEAEIRSPDGLPTTWYSFVKKIAMTRPEVDIKIGEDAGEITIHHPAIKSYEIVGTGIKAENLSNLEDHISTFARQNIHDLIPTAIKVTTLAEQEYTFPYSSEGTIFKLDYGKLDINVLG